MLTIPKKILLYLVLGLAITLVISACSKRLFTVYKIDVQQGNALESNEVEQLQIGMTKEQVQFLLGNPLIADIFHPDRWDYIYYLIPGYGERERRQLIVYFDGDKVVDIEKNIPIQKADTQAAAKKESKKKDKDKKDKKKDDDKKQENATQTQTDY